MQFRILSKCKLILRSLKEELLESPLQVEDFQNTQL